MPPVQGEGPGAAGTQGEPYASPTIHVADEPSTQHASRLVRGLRMSGWVFGWFAFGIVYRMVYAGIYMHAWLGGLAFLRPTGITYNELRLAASLLPLPTLALFAWGAARLLNIRGPLAFVIAGGTFLATFFIIVKGGTPVPPGGYAAIFVVAALLVMASPHRWRTGATASS